MNITVSITIAVPDDDPTSGGDFAADLVAHTLTHYSDPTITVTREAAAIAATETGPYFRPLVDEIDFYERETRAAARYEARRGRSEAAWADFDRILGVECPRCAAEPHSVCMTVGGHQLTRPKVHADRRAAWIRSTDGFREVAAIAATDEVAYCICGHNVYKHAMGDHGFDGECLATSCDCPMFEQRHRSLGDIAIPLDEM